MNVHMGYMSVMSVQPVITRMGPIPALAMTDGQAMDLLVTVSIGYCTY